MRKALLAAGFTLTCLLPSEAGAVSFSKMYVFGDSLSDPGNIYNATSFGERFTSSLSFLPSIPDAPVQPPVPPYDEEGRFSNGPIWIDYLAEDLGLSPTPSTELSVLSFGFFEIDSPISLSDGELEINSNFDGATADEGVNFAFGGAQTGQTGAGESGELIPGLLKQVQWFEADLLEAEEQADNEALYVVWAGSNDYQIVEDADPSLSVTNILHSVESLYQLGARQIMVPNLPDLGKTARALDPNPPVASELLTQRTIEHNALLKNATSNLSQSYTDLNLIPVDVYSLFNNITLSPSAFNFAIASEPCLDEATLGVCSNPDEYVFWDQIHPTTATHEQLADFALSALQPSLTAPELIAAAAVASVELEDTQQSSPHSIPEPTTVLPLGLLGLSFFRRLRKSL